MFTVYPKHHHQTPSPLFLAVGLAPSVASDLTDPAV